MKHILLTFIIACFSLTWAAAQTENQWIAFKLVTLEKTGKNKYQGTINYGSELGIVRQQAGELWTVVNSQREGLADYVAAFIVEEVRPGFAKVTFETEKKMFVGDVVFLELPVKQQFHSSYFYVAIYAIEITNEAGKPYYTLSELLESDGHRLRTEKFISMQMEINAAGEKLKQSGNRDKVEAGEHAGKFVHEVLTATDTLAVWNYLYHITRNYTVTVGQTLPLVAKYTNYVREGDNITDIELRELFIGVSESKWEQNYQNYKRKITKEILDAWVEDAKKAREKEDYKKAENILRPAIFLSSKLGKPYDEGVYIYEVALIYDGQSDNEKAAPVFQQAYEKFKLAGNDYAAGVSAHYAAIAYSKSGHKKEAKELFDIALPIRQALYKQSPKTASYFNDVGSTLQAIAVFYRDGGDYKMCMEYYDRALKFAIESEDNTSIANAYWNMGYAQGEAGKNYALAIQTYEQAYNYFEKVGDISSMIELRRNQAIYYFSLKNTPKAKETIEKAIALARKKKDVMLTAYALEYQGTLYSDNKEYSQSIASYSEAEKIYLDTDNTEKRISVIKTIADVYKKSKNYPKALAKLQERLNLLEEDDASGRGDALWDIALLYDKEQYNNQKKAIEYYLTAEKKFIEISDTARQISMKNNIGYQYRHLKDSVNAYKSHEAALALSKNKPHMLAKRADSYERYAFTVGDFKNRKKQLALFAESQKLYTQASDLVKAGYIAESIGDVYQEINDYEAAGKYYMESVKIYREAGSKSNEAESYWDYGYNQGQHLRQYDVAIASYRTAYDLYMQEKDSVNASVMLSNIGQNYWSKLNFEKAIETHQAAIALASKCKNYEQEASSWSKLATLYTETNNPIAGTKALKNSVEAAEHLSDSTLLSNAYNDLASSYLKGKDYQLSFDYYNKAIAMRKAQKDSINWASSLYSLAGAYQNKLEYTKSEATYQDALKIQRKIKDRSGVVYTLVNLATISQNVDNNYAKSELYFKEAIKLATELKDDNVLAYSYLRMKGLYRSQGKSAQADQYADKALDLYKKSKQWKDVATTLTEIGSDASYVYGDNQKALKLFDQAQVIADTLNDTYTKAYLAGARGSVMREMGEFTKALALAGESLKFYQEVKNDWGIAGVHIDYGNIYKQLSEYTLALHHQQAADSLYKILHADYSRLAPLANIGEIYTSQGDYAKGLQFYEQSLAIMTKANDLNENLSIIQACIGEAYFYMGKYEDSDKWLKESLKTCDLVGALRSKADALGVMARLKIEENKYDEADRYLKEGLTLSKAKSLKIAYSTGLGLAGQLNVRKKNYTAAKPLLEESIKLSRDMGKYGSLWESLYWLGVLYKENKQLPQSKQYLTEAVEVIEKIRNKVSGGEEARKMFSSDKNILKVYEALVSVLLDLNETDLAMSYIQKNNEDNLKAKFKGIDVKFENKDKNKIIEQERDMKAKLDGIEQQIANEKALPTEKQNLEKLKNLQGTKTVAEGDYLKFVNQQVNVRPELSKFFNNSVQPAQLKGKKKQIPKDMALLSYLPGENQLYIFIATSDTVLAKVVDINRSDLTKNINAVLNIVRTHQGSFGKIDLKTEEAERKETVATVTQTDPMLKPFEELYHYMIAPVSAEIANKKRLCVIPNGALSYIPFQLLGKTLKNGKFSLLMNQYAIFYANSTDMLLRSIEEGDRKFNILAFGNPDKSLPSTEKEVRELKKLFPNAAIFLREEATEDKAKFAGEEYNVMHFATHGNLDYEDFGKSFLTMAENPSKDEDGLLTLEELWGMDVMSHLNIVVLSACQTAVSKGSDESSPVSPASGFLQNGVKSVVATLWKVDDEATSLLIMDFYKNIKTMDALDALRLAQVNLANHPKYNHPYYWAAAVLLGDWR